MDESMRVIGEQDCDKLEQNYGANAQKLFVTRESRL